MQAGRQEQFTLTREQQATQLALFKAIRASKIERVESLLQNKADPNSPYKPGEVPPIEYAIRKGRLDCVHALIQAGAVCRGENGVFAMHLAAQYDQPEILRYLFQSQDILYSMTDAQGCQPLHRAAQANAAKAFQFLLDRLAHTIWDPETQHGQFVSEDQMKAMMALYLEKTVDHAGRSVVLSAVEHGATDVLGVLVARQIELTQFDEEGGTLMHHAARLNAVACIPFLRRLGLRRTQTDRQGRRPIHFAAMQGHWESIYSFACATGEPWYHPRDHQDKQTLHYLAEYGHFELMRKFCLELKGKVDCADKQGMTLLHYACFGGNLDAVKWLIANGGGAPEDQDQLGRNSLHHAARGNQPEIIAYLIGRCRVSRESPCNKGLFPIHYAVAKGAKEALSLLASLGCGYELAGRGGLLPIHIACKNGHPEMFDFLVLQGADPNALSERGRNGWFYATGTNKLEMLAFLWEKQMPIIADCSGQTPLHVAAQAGFFACARFFCEHGVDVEKTNSAGQTAEEVAERYAQRHAREGTENLAQKCQNLQRYLARVRGEKHVLFKSSASLELVRQRSLEKVGSKKAKRQKVSIESGEFDLSILRPFKIASINH